MKNIIPLLLFSLFFTSCGENTKRNTQTRQDNSSISNQEQKNQVENCNKNSGKVCAVIPCPPGAMCFIDPIPSTYLDQCEMIKAKAVFLYNGPCR